MEAEVVLTLVRLLVGIGWAGSHPGLQLSKHPCVGRRRQYQYHNRLRILLLLPHSPLVVPPWAREYDDRQ